MILEINHLKNILIQLNLCKDDVVFLTSTQVFIQTIKLFLDNLKWAACFLITLENISIDFTIIILMKNIIRNDKKIYNLKF